MGSDDSLPNKLLSWSFLGLKIVIASCAIKGLLLLCGFVTPIPVVDSIFYFILGIFKSITSTTDGMFSAPI